MLEKTCKKCLIVKPEASFRAQRSRGREYRMGKCLDCESVDNRAYKRKKRLEPGQVAFEAERMAKWLKSPRGKATRKAYRSTPRGVLYERVRHKVSRAVKAGRLASATAVPCEAGPSGCRGIHHWHHDNYEEEHWLDVRCLCQTHHTAWHAENEPTYPVEAGK